MKIKGSVEIRVVDSRTGKVKEVIKQNNLITNTSYLDVLTWGGRGVFSDVAQPQFGNIRRTYIFISSSTTQPNLNISTPPNLIATGYIPSGVQAFTWNESTNPAFGQVQNRIDFTGTERTFTTVGLLNEHRCYAILLLDTPCIQGAYDYLDIFYRVQFLNNTGQGLSKQAIVDFGGKCFGARNFRMGELYTSACSLPNSIHLYDALYYGDSVGASIDYGRERINSGWASGTVISDHFKFKSVISFDLSSQLGQIFNLMQQGSRHDGRGVYAWNSINVSPGSFQNLFSHSPDATVPFFDSLKLASGNGKVLLNGSWTNKFPELYKITIVADGATGVATYKWSVRRHLGFNGNAYSDRSVGCPFRNPTTAAFEKCHGWRDENNDVLRYSPTQIVQYDDTGVTLLDLMDGAYTNWDSTTTPALPVSQARQCATDGSKIYVGCRNTGLWIIDVVTNTITNPITAPVYGVDVGRGGVVYAIANGALSCSTDWAMPLDFTYAGITDGNWSQVQFLKCDPEHAEDRMALVMTVPNTSNRRVVWWNVATGTAATGVESTAIKPWAASLDVSDSGGFWASGAGRLAFASSSTATLGGTLSSQSITHSTWGTDNFYKISFYKQNVICQDRIVSNTGATIKTYAALSGRAFLLHMDGGIILTNREMRHLFTDNGNDFTWDHYGWNGTSWELNHAGAKTTHITDQPLLNGITARFEDGANEPHWVAADFYTQGVCNGLLKDNASTVFYSSAWYSVPAQFKFPVQSGLTVPMSAPYQVTLSAASDPSFIRIETDSPELIQLTINGQPVTTVYIGGTIPPAPNEVRVDASGNGVIEFHSSAAGAMIGGTYAYLKR